MGSYLGRCPRLLHFAPLALGFAGTKSYYFFFTAFSSDSSMTGAGPEIPPSLRMRQKCTAIKIEATSGMPMQCHIYERSSAFESTIDPPNNPKRTSLKGVIPSCGPKG